MKTFLKVVLLVLVALLALKLLPFTFALGCGLALLLVGLVMVGVSALAGLALLAVILGAALSPIWIPVLAIIGLIALLRRGSRRSVAG